MLRVSGMQLKTSVLGTHLHGTFGGSRTATSRVLSAATLVHTGMIQLMPRLNPSSATDLHVRHKAQHDA
jgi:hypothetical protein